MRGLAWQTQTLTSGRGTGEGITGVAQQCQPPPPPMAFCGWGSIVVQAKQHPASRPAGPVAHPMQGFWGLAWIDMYMCGCIHRRVRGLSTTCAWGQPTNPTIHPVLGALQSSCAVRTLC